MNNIGQKKEGLLRKENFCTKNGLETSLKKCGYHLQKLNFKGQVQERVFDKKMKNDTFE